MTRTDEIQAWKGLAIYIAAFIALALMGAPPWGALLGGIAITLIWTWK
jgi:hypothetical protein